MVHFNKIWQLPSKARIIMNIEKNHEKNQNKMRLKDWKLPEMYNSVGYYYIF